MPDSTQDMPTLFPDSGKSHVNWDALGRSDSPRATGWHRMTPEQAAAYHKLLDGHGTVEYGIGLGDVSEVV